MKEINNIIRISKKRMKLIRSLELIRYVLAFTAILFCCKFLYNSLIHPLNCITFSKGMTKGEQQYEGVDLFISLDDSFKTAMYYYEIYENGQLTERRVLNIQEQKATQQEFCFVPFKNDDGAYHAISYIKANNLDGYHMASLELSKTYDGIWNQDILQKRSVKIEPRQDLILDVLYLQNEAAENVSVSCKSLNKLTTKEQQNVLKQQEFALVLRAVYSDLAVNETRDLIEETGLLKI